MSELYQKKVRKRTILLFLAFSFWVCGLAVRLIQLQVIEHPRLKAEVIEQNQNKREIFAKRGTIYDRRGKILARSLPVDSVFLTPYDHESLENQMEKLDRLRKILDLSAGDIQRIELRIENRDRFIWIKRKIDSEAADKVRNLALNGVFLLEENKRFYPQGKLAAHILGGVNIDDKGLSGIEYSCNAVLEGQKGESLILRDARRRGYHFETLKEAAPGKDLVLTIDETIQYIAEKELEKAVTGRNARWGTVIISNPSSGEILALANYPSYDPNFYPPPSPEEESNRGIRHNFEPGSTFKIVTAAAARENRLVRPTDMFDCSEGAIAASGRAIRDHKRFGVLSFPEVFIHSSNVGTIQIGYQIGETPLFKTIKSFGFGEKTGIGLPGEEAGIFRPVTSWTRRSLPSLSIGYEISVTAIQLLQAMNIIANRGLPTSPEIVMGTSDDAGEDGPFHGIRVLSESTAEELVSILEKAVEEGTGPAARIPGYRVAGKTGTAQKFDPAIRAYSSSKHLASFIGIVPSDKPVISMIVVIDEPKGGLYYGGQVAAPIFREIGIRVLRYLQIPPQSLSAPTLITAQLWSELER